MRQKIVLAMIMLSSCAPSHPPGVPRALAEISGRTPGPPKDCLPIVPTQGLHVADDRSTLVYGSGRTIWVNSPAGSCRFAFNDIPVFEPHSGSYCRGDIVRSVDRDSNIPGPACILGDFVPYTRP